MDIHKATGKNEGVRLLFVSRTTSGVGRRMESVIATLEARKRDGKNRHPVARICGRATLDEIESVIAAVTAA